MTAGERAEIEDLMVRGRHPTTHISWYAPIVVIREGMGALTAKPCVVNGRCFPGLLRVCDLVLVGSARERIETAALLAFKLRAKYGFVYGGAIVILRKHKPWARLMARLMVRMGGEQYAENDYVTAWRFS